MKKPRRRRRWPGLEREAERLLSESDVARQELTQLGLERGQVKLSFESVTERLHRLEAEIAALRLEIEGSRNAESQSKKRGDQLRGEQATLMGRRNSLETLIREHSYSTDTVKNLFRARPSAGAGELAPMGTLADFLKVDGKYESIVDEFLRDELNYVVVKSWDSAGEGLRLLQKDVAGSGDVPGAYGRAGWLCGWHERGEQTKWRRHRGAEGLHSRSKWIRAFA